MPITEHTQCEPPDVNDTIWRYMDFTQFISILENKQLFFCRADRLGDPYEGSLPKQHSEFREEQLKEYPSEWVHELLPRFREICTKHTFLSCWHINNEGESAAMWDLYLKSNEGICIQTTYGKLVEAIEARQNEEVYTSKVRYIDYEEERLSGWREGAPLGDTMSPFIHKRKSFRHEKELRAIIHDLPWKESADETLVTAEEIKEAPLENEYILGDGRSIAVDLDALIETVYIAPHAGDWIQQLVEDVGAQYHLDPGNIEKSSMTRDPLY